MTGWCLHGKVLTMTRCNDNKMLRQECDCDNEVFRR